MTTLQSLVWAVKGDMAHPAVPVENFRVWPSVICGGWQSEDLTLQPWVAAISILLPQFPECRDQQVCYHALLSRLLFSGDVFLLGFQTPHISC